MSTQPTNLPVPSESPRDLKFNAGKIDEFVTSMGWTYTDRFGNKHYTIEGINYLAKQAIAASGYITMDSFQAGATLTLPNQVLRDTSTGEYYRWDGVIPKSVPAGSTPASAGGVGTGAWISVGDAALRQQINSADGFKLVGAASSYANLKTIVPGYNGQRIQLREYTAGTGYGGGVFVAVNYAYTDDSGIHASVNSSWHWRREFTGPATPEMFGGIPDGGADSVDAVERCKSYCGGAGRVGDFSGTWNLSRDVALPSDGKHITSSGVLYTGVGEFLISGGVSRGIVRSESPLIPVVGTEPGTGIQGTTSAGSRVKTQFECFIQGADTSSSESYSLNGIDCYDGYFYTCSKSWATDSQGIVNRFAAGGMRDATFGGTLINIQHTADCFFRPTDGCMYVINGSTGQQYLYKLATNGASISQQWSLPSNYQHGLVTLDKINDLVIIHYLESSDTTAPSKFGVFKYGDYTSPLFTISPGISWGVPLGVVAHGGHIYYLSSDHGGLGIGIVTVIDMSGTVLGTFNCNLADEAEGICVASEYGTSFLCIGTVGPSRLLSIRNGNSSRSKYWASGFNLNGAGGNVSMFPVTIPFVLQRMSDAWGFPSTVNWRGAWGAPVVDGQRIKLTIRRNFVSAFLGGFANFQGTFYTLNKCYRVDLAVDSGHYLYIYFRDPATNAYVDISTITGSCVITGLVFATESMTDSGYDYSA